MKIKKVINRKIKGVLNKLPYIRVLYQQSTACRFPNGHFYSPVYSIEDVKKRQFEIWKNVDVDEIQGIELRTIAQKKIVKELEKYYKELPFKAEKQDAIRYQFENNSYSYTDAIILYSMIRHIKPKRIIEIGSGFTSAIMMDTNELFFENTIDLIFIEPYPERLFSLMKQSDNHQNKVMVNEAQQIPLTVFEQMEAGDILFIDSTHVSKTGSDVNFILFEVLPILKSGVLIHFHDVFYPFEYPKDWVFNGFNWNEDYILKAFLMYNEKFEIKLFADYLHKHHTTVFKEMPLCYKNTGGNLWIEKK